MKNSQHDFAKSDRLGLIATMALIVILLLACLAMQGCATRATTDGAHRPALTPAQQAQVNRFISALVSGGIQYYEASKAMGLEKQAYEAAKKTAVQAGGIVAVTAYGAMHYRGKPRDGAIAEGKAAAEAWCVTQGTTLASVMATVAAGAPAKVDGGAILEGIIAEQLRYIAAQQADAP